MKLKSSPPKQLAGREYPWVHHFDGFGLPQPYLSQGIHYRRSHQNTQVCVNLRQKNKFNQIEDSR